jgi:hypothetical protein
MNYVHCNNGWTVIKQLDKYKLMIRSPILIYTYIFFIYMIIYYVIRYTDGETFWLKPDNKPP